MIYKNRRTHRMRRLENRVAQLERMASAYTVVMATPEERIEFPVTKPRLMTPQEWASTPIPLPKTVISDMILFEDGSLRPAHVKTPGDDKLNGWAIPVAVKRLKGYEEMRTKLEDADERAHKAGYDLECLRAQMERMRSVVGVVPDITEEDYESIAILMRENGLGLHSENNEEFRRIAMAAWQCAQAYSVDASRLRAQPHIQTRINHLRRMRDFAGILQMQYDGAWGAWGRRRGDRYTRFRKACQSEIDRLRERT